jgi:putative oxidoreductase
MPYSEAGGQLQRLFWSFASGWPGIGLLIQRITTGSVLFYCAVASLDKTSQPALIAAPMIGAAAGILLLVGFWTPIAGGLIAVVEVWMALSNGGNPLISIMLATFGFTLATIGPGAWSIDARLFGRKHIDAP